MSGTDRKRRPRTFRCTDEDWALIDLAAGKVGLTVSDFVAGSSVDAARDEAARQPLILSAKTQDKLVRGLFMLIIDRHLQLRNEGCEEHLANILKRAQELFDDAQTGTGPPTDGPSWKDG